MDYLNKYAPKSAVTKHQEGGMVAPEAAPAMAPEAAPAPAGGGDLEGMVMEYAQTRDPQLAVAIADMLVELIASQGAPAPAMSKGGRMEARKAPMFSKGGKLKA